MSAIDFYSCFISYSREDKSFARRLHNDLQAVGIRVWLDEKNILPGDDIADAIDRGVRIWDKVVLCCSRASLLSSWVDEEINKAKQKERKLWKERGQKTLAIIPVDLDGYVFSGEWTSSMVSEITRRHIERFEGWETDNKVRGLFL